MDKKKNSKRKKLYPNGRFSIHLGINTYDNVPNQPLKTLKQCDKDAIKANSYFNGMGFGTNLITDNDQQDDIYEEFMN